MNPLGRWGGGLLMTVKCTKSMSFFSRLGSQNDVTLMHYKDKVQVDQNVTKKQKNLCQ